MNMVSGSCDMVSAELEVSCSCIVLLICAEVIEDMGSTVDDMVSGLDGVVSALLSVVSVAVEVSGGRFMLLGFIKVEDVVDSSLISTWTSF
jgi:hypothetical protein